MRRIPTSSPAPYRVSFSTEAWKQIGTMPSSVFQALRGTLARMANELHPRGPQSPQRVILEGVEVIYTWDEATSEVRLVCSWDTTEDEVDAFAADVRRACAAAPA